MNARRTTTIRRRTTRRSRRNIRRGAAMYRSPKMGEASVACEFYQFAEIDNGANIIHLGSTNDTFMNISQCLTSSISWTKYANLYSKVKIVGFSLHVSPMAASYPSITFVPNIIYGFYPSYTSTNLLTEPQATDNNMMTNPLQLVPQQKSWRFKENFFSGPDGTGYGVWFNPNLISSLSGQISVYPSYPTSSATAQTFLQNLRLKVYCVFGQKNY